MASRKEQDFKTSVELYKMNFKKIEKYSHNQLLRLIDKVGEDNQDSLTTMRKTLENIKKDKNLSTCGVLDKFGQEIADKIEVTVDERDWNAWVAKLFAAKCHLERLFDTKNLTEEEL